MQIDKLVYESDAILFMGYGFNDKHLNKSFSYLRQDNKIRKVVVIDWAHDHESSLNFRQDNWTFGLGSTIPYNGHEMGDGKRSLPNLAAYFKKNNLLEKSSNPDLPLAVWYNGILEACDHSERIRNELL